MKKIWFIILIILPLIFAGLALAATQSGEVNINATIPTTGSPPVGPTYQLTIEDLEVTNIDCAEVLISWQTILMPDDIPEATTGYLEYWRMGETATRIDLVTSSASHSVSLTNLTLLDQYQFLIYVISDAGRNTTRNGIFVFECVVPNPNLSVLARNQGTEIHLVYPQFNDLAGFIIYRGQTSCPSGQEVFYATTTSKTAGAVEVIPGDVFMPLNSPRFYTVCLYNSMGVYATGVSGSAERRIFEVASSAAAPGDQTVNLSWVKPNDNSFFDFVFNRVLIRRSTLGCNDPNSLLIYEGGANEYLDSGLNNNQTYYYQLKVRNQYQEETSGWCLSATPAAVAPNYCVTNVNVLAGNNRVDISWLNPVSQSGFIFNTVNWQRNNLCAAGSGDGQRVYAGDGQNFTDFDVVNNQLYAYTSFVNFNQNQTINCGCFLATPRDDSLPIDDIIDELPCPDCGPSIDYPYFSFAVNNGALAIYPDNQNQLFILAGYTLKIKVPRNSLSQPVNSIIAQIAANNYPLVLDANNYYQTSLAVPRERGDYQLRISTVYQDQTAARQVWQLKILPWGYVYLNKKSEERLPGAVVTLYQGDSPFQGFGVNNPQITGENGLYGLMVPNGQYDLEVSKKDYRNFSSGRLTVENNIINLAVPLSPEENLLTELINAFTGFINHPLVETINEQYAVPGILAVAVINILVSVPWWNLLYYLQYLFTQPFIWFSRKRRQGWGIIYNSITKKPIDLAVVRLYEYATKKLLRSIVTDHQGRYNFLVDEGEYGLDVTKSGFSFPSDILKGLVEDKNYTDLYHGQMIKVSEGEKGLITANIPLDQEDAQIDDQKLLRQNFWFKVRRQVGVVGPVLSIVSFIVSPTLFVGMMVALHWLIYALFKRLAAKESPRTWGIIYDAQTKKPLAKAIARIFSPEYDKMLEAQVTDRHGRYGFLAGNAVYYLTGSKEGYKQYQSEHLDLSQKRAEEVLGRDMPLELLAGKPAPDQIKVEPVPEKPVASQPVEEKSPTSETESPVSGDSLKAADSETKAEEITLGEQSSMEAIAEKIRAQAMAEIKSEPKEIKSTETDQTVENISSGDQKENKSEAPASTEDKAPFHQSADNLDKDESAKEAKNYSEKEKSKLNWPRKEDKFG